MTPARMSAAPSHCPAERRSPSTAAASARVTAGSMVAAVAARPGPIHWIPIRNAVMGTAVEKRPIAPRRSSGAGASGTPMPPVASPAAEIAMAVDVRAVAVAEMGGKPAKTPWLRTIHRARNTTASMTSPTPSASPPPSPVPTVSAHPAVVSASAAMRRGVSRSPTQNRARSTVIAG